jgi:hypothetical protein
MTRLQGVLCQLQRPSRPRRRCISPRLHYHHLSLRCQRLGCRKHVCDRHHRRHTLSTQAAAAAVTVAGEAMQLLPEAPTAVAGMQAVAVATKATTAARAVAGATGTITFIGLMTVAAATAA